MKQKIHLRLYLLIAALVFVLAGCGDDEAVSSSIPQDEVQSVASSMPQSSPADDSSQPSSQMAASSAAPPPAAVQLEAGRFLAYNDDRFAEERTPYIELSDSQVMFRVNTGMELATVTGSYSISGTNLTITIEELEAAQLFPGYTAGALTFTVLDENTLEYSGDNYGLTQAGNIFVREGEQPYVPPEPESMPASGADDSMPSATEDDSMQPATEQPDDDQSMPTAQPQNVEPETATYEVAAGEAPPATMAPGESFILFDMAPDSLVYDEGLFSMRRGQDGQSVILTALKAGEGMVAFALIGETDQEEYTVNVESSGISPVVLIIAIVGALVLGSGATATVLIIRGRKSGGKKGRKGGKKGRKGGAGAGGSKDVKKAEQKLKQAQKRKAQKDKAAAAAASSAGKAAIAAANAAQAVQQAEEALQQASNQPPKDTQAAGGQGAEQSPPVAGAPASEAPAAAEPTPSMFNSGAYTEEPPKPPQGNE